MDIILIIGLYPFLYLCDSKKSGKMSDYIKGRGAQKQIHNKFYELKNIPDTDYLNYCAQEEDEFAIDPKTHFKAIFPKMIVNKVHSPDLRFKYSINPYQGCEHGCVYCYARNSHQYWGYGPGLDFEKQILIKRDAPKLLEKTLQKKSWKVGTIVFSGNTDCYQPIEKKEKVTRDCLKIMLKYKHPTGIITKNALLTRDLDILKDLARDNLIKVNISITTLSEETRRLLEPRTSTIKKRFQAVEALAKNDIPVAVMMAPIIPGINSHEIFPLLKRASEAGAWSAHYSLVHLNGAVGEIFADWIEKAMPQRAAKVLNLIKSCHGGKLNESQFGKRFRGDGKIAEQIAQEFKIARSKFFPNRHWPQLNYNLYQKAKNPQYSLF